MNYEGIITPIITPFDRKGSIDYDGTSKLLEFLNSNGVTGVFPLGSTGLFPWLSFEEKKEFISYVVENAGKLKVIAGIGSSNVNESRELGKHAKDVGADASVLMATYYIQPSQEWIQKQFNDVMAGNDMNFFIYSIPQLAGVWIDIETIKHIREEHSNIVGAKESSGDMRYFSRLVAMKSSDFAVFQGQDDLLLASLALGASGGVCGLSNFSESIALLDSLYRSDKKDSALELQMKVVNPLIKGINVPKFPSGYYYASYKRLGLESGFRSPMTPLNDNEKQVIDRSLNEAENLLQRYK